MKSFPNLAMRTDPMPSAEVLEELDQTVEAELHAAGLVSMAANFGPQICNMFRMAAGEVPTKHVGMFPDGSGIGWTFKRAWYYWVCSGPGIPPDDANKLHAIHGRQVRVDGHCGCPSPEECFKGFAVGLYHVDTPEGLAALVKTLLEVRSRIG
jgi:hypothetical protein